MTAKRTRSVKSKGLFPLENSEDWIKESTTNYMLWMVSAIYRNVIYIYILLLLYLDNFTPTIKIDYTIVLYMYWLVVRFHRFHHNHLPVYF